MKKRLLHFFYVLAIAPICLCCSSRDRGSDTTTAVDSTSGYVMLSEEQFRSAGIETGTVVTRTMHETVKANGVLDVPPQNLVSISAPLGGFVKNTELLQGMKVQKGQLLVTLEHPDYIQLQQDYLDLKSQMEFQQEEFQRQEALARENVTAAKTLQLARANFQSTSAKVQGLQAKLRMINIDPADLAKGTIRSVIPMYAPISGFVTQVNVNMGMHVDPSIVMFRIVDNSHLHAEAQVFEKDISKLKAGQTVRFTLANDSQERKAKVYLIGKEITPDRTVRVHCHLDQEDPNLIPGMYFSALIEIDDRPVTTLPGSAVVNFGNKNYIFIVKDGPGHHYEMIEVQTGTAEGGFVEVVIPKETQASPIVTKGAFELLAFLKNKDE